MSMRAVVLAAVRLTAVFIILRLILLAAYWIVWFSYDDYRSSNFWIAIVLFTFWLLTTLFLVRYPSRLMAWLSPESKNVANFDEAQVQNLEIIGIKLIGLFFFAQVTIELLEYLLYFFVRFPQFGARTFEVIVMPLSTDNVASISYISAKSVVAMWLMAGPRLVQRFVNRLRSAGREWMDEDVEDR